jgi:hypothetical protein
MCTGYEETLWDQCNYEDRYRVRVLFQLLTIFFPTMFGLFCFVLVASLLRAELLLFCLLGVLNVWRRKNLKPNSLDRKLRDRRIYFSSVFHESRSFVRCSKLSDSLKMNFINYGTIHPLRALEWVKLNAGFERNKSKIKSFDWKMKISKFIERKILFHACCMRHYSCTGQSHADWTLAGVHEKLAPEITLVLNVILCSRTRWHILCWNSIL